MSDTTTAVQEANGGAVDDPSCKDVQPESPTKRRKIGKRSINSDLSAEERKRLRVLKNRESAMRSLAKKAEYSAQLEVEQRETYEEFKATRTALERTLASANALRTALEEVPDDITQLISQVETSIKKATVLANGEDVASDTTTQNGVDDKTQQQTN